MYYIEKEIISVKFTNVINNNIKLIKRKLNIYNLQNDFNYKLENLGINIIYNRFEDKTSIFYYYKELNESFDYNLLDIYKENYFKASQFLKGNLEGCEFYKRKGFPNSIFLFKDGKFILEQDLKGRRFWLSDPLIWSKFESEFDFDYNSLEISNLCNSFLEKSFENIGFASGVLYGGDIALLEEAFKKDKFTKSYYQNLKDHFLGEFSKRINL